MNNLNGYYLPSRYQAEVGGATGSITAEDAAEALTWAESVAGAVRPYLTAGAD